MSCMCSTRYWSVMRGVEDSGGSIRLQAWSEESSLRLSTSLKEFMKERFSVRASESVIPPVEGVQCISSPISPPEESELSGSKRVEVTAACGSGERTECGVGVCVLPVSAPLSTWLVAAADGRVFAGAGLLLAPRCRFLGP